MLKILLIVVAVAVLGVLAYAATRPDTIHVERSARIAAPAEAIYPLIEDFHRWGAWSPYEKKDPAMKRTFGGPEHGPGATYAWDGNGQVGAGRMEILEAAPSSKLRIDLTMLAPMESHNIAQFVLQPDGDATRVTWSFDGPSPFVSKLMSVFFNLDKMIGSDFEVGLSNLGTATKH